MNRDVRWIRDIRLAHVHGMLVGFKKQLSYQEFTKKWVVLCSASNENPLQVDEDDKEIFNIINELHMGILDMSLNLVKETDIPDDMKLELLEIAKIIQEQQITENGKIK